MCPQAVRQTQEWGRAAKNGPKVASPRTCTVYWNMRNRTLRLYVKLVTNGLGERDESLAKLDTAIRAVLFSNINCE
jgi:hypothetical protein